MLNLNKVENEGGLRNHHIPHDLYPPTLVGGTAPKLDIGRYGIVETEMGLKKAVDVGPTPDPRQQDLFNNSANKNPRTNFRDHQIELA